MEELQRHQVEKTASTGGIPPPANSSDNNPSLEAENANLRKSLIEHRRKSERLETANSELECRVVDLEEKMDERDSNVCIKITGLEDQLLEMTKLLHEKEQRLQLKDVCCKILANHSPA